MVNFNTRILVVDDVPANVLYVMALLKTFGITPMSASGGKAAIKEVEKYHYDIVILDCHMPVVDGFAVAKAIRARNQETLIAGYTGDNSPMNMKMCKEAGIDQILRKPATLGDLKWLIARLRDPSNFKVS